MYFWHTCDFSSKRWYNLKTLWRFFKWDFEACKIVFYIMFLLSGDRMLCKRTQWGSRPEFVPAKVCGARGGPFCSFYLESLSNVLLFFLISPRDILRRRLAVVTKHIATHTYKSFKNWMTKNDCYCLFLAGPAGQPYIRDALSLSEWVTDWLSDKICTIGQSEWWRGCCFPIGRCSFEINRHVRNK